MMEEGENHHGWKKPRRKPALGLHVQYPRNDLAPYSLKTSANIWNPHTGTEAVHERGLRVYTTAETSHMQKSRQPGHSRRPAPL